MKNPTTRFAPPLFRTLLLAFVLLATPAVSSAAVYVSVAIAPPPLPVYTQPIVPGPGYIWTPGYWAYGPEGYYWVPGTWVLAPFVGALWTPGYWGWGGAAFIWHAGYWGPHVGFYGGINYGFGYIGVGYHGGYWNGGVFNYNRAVTNVNVTNIHNTYNQTVVQNTGLSHVSFNGGTGGVNAQPTPEERLAERDKHRSATQVQLRHEQLASTNRAQLASINHGTPSLMATPKAAVFRQPYAGTAKAGHPQNVVARQNAAYPQAHVQGQPHPQGQPYAKGQPHAQQPHPQHEAQKGHEEGKAR